MGNADSAGKKILIISGEASGDLHGANLVRAAQKKAPNVVWYGVGSRRMEEAGVRLIADASEISVVGLTEVLLHLPKIYDVLQRIKRFLQEQRPDLLVLIDFPDFNFRVGKIAKKLGIPIVYYISPQVWAWRKGRIKTIAKLVAAMIVVFPFKVPLYRDAGVDVRFEGHPLTDVVRSTLSQTEAKQMLGLDPARRAVALLPGSRRKEIANLLPDMLAAAEILKTRFPDLQFILPVAPTLSRDVIASFTRVSAVPVTLIDGRVYDVLRASDAAVVVSGTATLETALMEVPLVIVYRVSRLSSFIGRLLVRVDHIGLANIVAGKRVVPELVQEAVTPQAIAEAVTPMLADVARAAGIRAELAGIRARLGAGGANERIAAVVLEFLQTAKV